jgi:hypothetical protein
VRCTAAQALARLRAAEREAEGAMRLVGAAAEISTGRVRFLG